MRFLLTILAAFSAIAACAVAHAQCGPGGCVGGGFSGYSMPSYGYSAPSYSMPSYSYSAPSYSAAPAYSYSQTTNYPGGYGYVGQTVGPLGLMSYPTYARQPATTVTETYSAPMATYNPTFSFSASEDGNGYTDYLAINQDNGQVWLWNSEAPGWVPLSGVPGRDVRWTRITLGELTAGVQMGQAPTPYRSRTRTTVRVGR